LLPEDPDAASSVSIAGADVRRWAYRHARRAADLYGWNGRLIADFIKAKPALAALLAKAIARPPASMRSGVAASALWREAKGAVIPKAGEPDAYRPIAVSSFARRIWAAKATARVRPHATRFCEARGQLGLSGTGATIAYAALARWAIAAGGTMCSDDKSNSFGSIGRQPVIDAVAAAATDPVHPADVDTRRAYEAIVHRLFAGPPPPEGVGQETSWSHRTVHVYPDADNASHVNHALTQGSPEASVLEALAYACAASPVRPPQQPDGDAPIAEAPRALAHPLKLGFHDDAITLVGPQGTARVSSSDRPTLPAPPSRRSSPAPRAPSRPPSSTKASRAPSPTTRPSSASPSALARSALGRDRLCPQGRQPHRRPRQPRLPARQAPPRRHRRQHLRWTSRHGRPLVRAATPPSPALDAALDALDQQWIDLWVAITGVDAASPALRASIATRLYGPAPDGFGHRRCRDAHPVSTMLRESPAHCPPSSPSSPATTSAPTESPASTRTTSSPPPPPSALPPSPL
jgi:hypothetical protein